jgi:hypothetical protein
MLEHDMAVDLKTRLNFSDNEIDIATKIMRGDDKPVMIDEDLRKNAIEKSFNVLSSLIKKSKEIARRAKEGAKSPKPVDKAPDAPSGLPATQGTRDLTNKAPSGPPATTAPSGPPATQGARDVGSVNKPLPNGGPLAKPADKLGKTITPYNSFAAGSALGTAGALSLLTRDKAKATENNPVKPSADSTPNAAPSATPKPSAPSVTVNPDKPLGTGGIGSDAARAPNTNTNMRVVPSKPRKIEPDTSKPDAPVVSPPSGPTMVKPDASISTPSKPSVGSTAPSTGSGASTSPVKPSAPSTAKPAAKVIRQGSIIAPKKELSADDLNSISSNLAKGKDAGSSGALDEPMAKEKNSAAENIKKRLRQLNKEETDFTKMKEKKNKGKFEPVDDAPVERIENKRKPVKFGEPGNEKMSKEDVDSEEVDQEYINGIMEAEASSSHTGKIKSSKRIVKTLQKVLERGEPKDFQFENGTTVTLQPAMARMAIGYYNKLSEFEKAQAAKLMRQSFRDFLSIAKRK